MTDKNEETFGALLPEDEIKEWARILAPQIREFYESEDGQMMFVGWENTRKSKKRKDKKHQIKL